jgi:hypothetical protein
MLVTSSHTQEFVDGLNVKPVTAEYGVFDVKVGKKYDKVTVKPHRSSQTFVYAFVDSEGNVYKAAGWASPAKGIRYTNVKAALAAADPYGSFLYKR